MHIQWQLTGTADIVFAAVALAVRALCHAFMHKAHAAKTFTCKMHVLLAACQCVDCGVFLDKHLRNEAM